MKFQKLSALLCSTALALSMIPCAGATDPAPLSEHAGGTVSCEVFLDDGTSTIYEVAIPEGTTKEEEARLVQASIFGPTAASLSLLASDPQPGDWSGPFQYVDYTDDVPNMVSSWETEIGSGTLFSTYPTFVVQFTNLIPRNGATTLTIRLENETRGKSWSKDLTLGTVHDYVYFMYSRDSSLRLEMNNQVTVYAQANTGYVTADDCTLFGSPYDMG